MTLFRDDTMMQFDGKKNGICGDDLKRRVARGAAA